MKNKFFTLFAVAALAFPSFLVPTVSANAATAPNSPVSVGTSLNWSGYTATGGTFTSVGASWTIPVSAAPSGSPDALSADATWVGIGGVSSRDLIQAGTQTVFENGQNGSPSYQAWYETLPNSSQNVPLTIHPGDSMTVSLTEQSGNVWEVSFTDHTTGQSYDTSITYQSSLSSAEWIEEMPSATHSFVALDNFGTVSFTGGFATENGMQMDLSAANAQPLTMINNAGQALSTPSSLGAGGASFMITRTSVAATTGTGGAATPSSTGFGGGRGAGRWSRTGVGVQGYTAPTRTFRTVTGTTGTPSGVETEYSNGGYGFERFSLGNFTVFFRNFKTNLRNGWSR